jgi:hypothetical protein
MKPSAGFTKQHSIHNRNWPSGRIQGASLAGHSVGGLEVRTEGRLWHRPPTYPSNDPENTMPVILAVFSAVQILPRCARRMATNFGQPQREYAVVDRADAWSQVFGTRFSDSAIDRATSKAQVTAIDHQMM